MTGALGAELRKLPVARPDVFWATEVAIRVSFDFAQAQALEQLEDLACIGCGCTELAACPGGCSWVSLDPPVCSGCG